MDKRQKKINQWLSEELNVPVTTIAPATADASFRRYFRATTTEGSYVVMDAPLDIEPLEPFISIDNALLQLGVHAPKIYAVNKTEGFLLLEDLGDKLYLDALPQLPDHLYGEAIKALMKIQAGVNTELDYAPPNYDKDLLKIELGLFEEWYLNRHLQIELSNEQRLIWQNLKQQLIDGWFDQPQVWVHRDYHSRNLMIVAENSPAVIDFQTMVIGPVGYDLASLFKDCYIRWPREQQLQWLAQYHQQASEQFNHIELTLDELIRYFDLCGLQRHLKVLGIFCRLNYRDDKPDYLNDLPTVKNYILEVLALYSEFHEFNAVFKELHHSA